MRKYVYVCWTALLLFCFGEEAAFHVSSPANQHGAVELTAMVLGALQLVLVLISGTMLHHARGFWPIGLAAALSVAIGGLEVAEALMFSSAAEQAAGARYALQFAAVGQYIALMFGIGLWAIAYYGRDAFWQDCYADSAG